MNKNTIVSRWLLVIMSLIIVIIVVGAITRLTNSGLSMTSWGLVEILPPINEEDWFDKFEEYRQTPDYQKQSISPLNISEFIMNIINPDTKKRQRVNNYDPTSYKTVDWERVDIMRKRDLLRKAEEKLKVVT